MLVSEKFPSSAKFLRNHLAETFIVLGLLLMSINAVHFSLRDRVLSVHSDVIMAYQAANDTRLAEPVKIVIPWRVDTTIEPGVIEKGKWTVHEETATYLASSARPGESGNIILYGHNTRDILGNIRALQSGEIITLTAGNGQKYQYQVEATQQVKADNLEWLGPTDAEVLTIYTCAGFLDQERFLVRAVPVPQETPQEDPPDEA